MIVVNPICSGVQNMPKAPKITVKNVFAFQIVLIGNRKSHKIWGCLEAILEVMGLIYGGLNRDSNGVKCTLQFVG